MAKNIQHLQHVKSSVVENGAPKLPQPSVLVEGEIAVNYADGYETLSIKTSSGNIATFSSDTIRERDNRVIAEALIDLAENKLDASAYTPTDLSNYYTKDETSGASEIAEALSAKADTTWVENKERAVAAALVDLNDRKADASGVTDLTQAVNTISGDVDTLVDQNEVIAAALVDLDDRKMDASAYTPTDLSNYYNKTDIDNRLGSGITTANNVTKVIEENEVAIAAAIAELDDEKQDALVSGENIKTINQQSLIGSGDIAIESGFKKFTNPTASTNVGLVNSLVTTYGTNIGNLAVIEGNGCTASGDYSHAEGSGTTASGDYSHAEGYQTKATNKVEHASGQYNISSNANTTFGNNGNTLFSVGNGYNTANTHNAFEIRQNGDVYIANTDETTHSNYYQKDMYRLQDAVKSFGTVNANATAITATNAADTFTISGGTFLGVTADTANKKITLNPKTGTTSSYLARGDHSHPSNKVTAMTSYDTSGTDALPIATGDTLNVAVRKLENGVNDINTAMGGMKIVKITQAEYDALTTKDPNAIYIVV